MTTTEWVEQRLGGRIRLAVADRREAVKELADEGLSQRQIADVLGVAASTINDDVARVQNRTPDTRESHLDNDVSDGGVQDRTHDATTEHVCTVCGELFAREMWHCEECDHHWPLGKADCPNCYEEPNPRSDVVALLGAVTRSDALGSPETN